jgi:hypothetical protein
VKLRALWLVKLQSLALVNQSPPKQALLERVPVKLVSVKQEPLAAAK